MFKLIWAATTESHGLGNLKKKKFVFTVLESGKSKIKTPTDLVSDVGLLPGSQTIVFSW